MRRGNKIIIKAVWLLLIISIGVILFSGYKLWEGRQIYQKGDQSYQLLKQQIRYQRNSNYADDKEGYGYQAEPPADVPSAAIDFDALKRINSDAAAWLYGPDTPIDYPVMRADDYDWYLHHLPDGTYNANGTLFLDCNSPDDFSGGLSIIYGHHMKSGKMFGSLKGYKQQEYYQQHPCLYLYTEQEDYRIDLLYGCVIDAGEWRERAFMYEINLPALLEYGSSKTTFQSNIEYDADNDKFITLATCSYEFDDARYIVIGVMRPLNEQ